jgi:hypothetical protein
MRASTYRLAWPIAALIGALVLVPRAHAEESAPATLAALCDHTMTGERQ